MKDTLAQINISLSQSKTIAPFAVKSKMAELILDIMQQKKNFGMFVIVGWKNKWQRYADTPDASQDIFALHQTNIMKIKSEMQTRKKSGITKTVNFDGAILIDRRGNILRSGAMIEGLRPRATAHKLNPSATADLSAQFGFKRKVHMRHIAAITSSYLFKGTTVFTVSEETGDLHIFENGKIIHSTVRGEPVK
jgi:DNA integrity scanning protein DisA with diadenylate cyclase activity